MHVRTWSYTLLSALCLSLAACPPQSGGGNENDNGANDNSADINLPPDIELDQSEPITGRVVLPDGMTTDPATLKVLTTTGESAVDADGAFTASLFYRTPSFMQVVDASNESMLMGFVNPSATDAPQLDTRSTAVALLYFANAGWTFFPDSLQNALDLLAQSQAATDLATALDLALAANPSALHDGDPAVIAALEAAHEATKFPTPPRDSTADDDVTDDGMPPVRAKLGPRLQSGGVSPLLLITPDANTRQSGVQIVQNPAGEGIAAINNFRRRAMLFVYKTATEDDMGNRQEITPAEFVDELPIPTTFRLGLFSSVHAVVSGSASWAPVTTPGIELTHDPAFDKTFYEAVVVGTTLDAVSTPAIISDPQFANFVGTWSATADQLQWKLILADFFLPILETVAFGAALSGLEAAPVATLDAFIAAQDPVLLQIGVAVPRTHAALQAFIQTAVRSMADDAVYSAGMYSLLRNLGPAIAGGQATLQTLQTNVRAFATSAALLRAIQLAMTALDLGAVIKDNQSSSWADGWEITAAPRTVHINPTSTRVEIGETRNFTAMLSSPPTGTLVYEWSTSGDFGTLGDGITQGDTIQSVHSTVVYSSDPNASDGDRDTVTVRVFLENASGEQILVGELEEPAEIIAQEDPVCDELDTAPYTSGCGNISLSSTDITAGEFMTVTVNVGCGGGTLYCDYVAEGTLEVDGAPATGGGFVNLYPYDPPTPVSRGNGAGVSLTQGGHTVRFQIPLSAPNDCLAIGAPAFGRTNAVGPWCFLGGSSPNTWSSVAHFRVRQGGL